MLWPAPMTRPAAALCLLALLVGASAYVWADDIDRATGTELAADTISLEAGWLNVGPVTSAEPDRFVRMGGNDGWEDYVAVTVTQDSRYARLLLMPTMVTTWPASDTIWDSPGHALDGRSTDPGASRWHYRPGRGADVRDQFVWCQLTGGASWSPGPSELRVGGGFVGLGQTRHQFWGARVGVAPLAEAHAGLRWRAAGLGCHGTAIRMGKPFGRWIVLEHAAGVDSPNGRRWILPVGCGVSLSM